jgi:Lon protease-like protein
MQQDLLPLFPLQAVLFPRTPLPLHIFEERYKEMMREVLDSQSEFGVVQAGEKGIVNMGCSASVAKVLNRYPDGRLDLFTVGQRRFEILSLDDGGAFLRGAVEFFDDDEFEPVDIAVRQQVLDRYRELCEISEPPSFQSPEFADPQLSFQLAQIVPDLDFRQVLLATRSEAARMTNMAKFLGEWLPRHRQALHARTVAPLNGHGRSTDAL